MHTVPAVLPAAHGIPQLGAATHLTHAEQDRLAGVLLSEVVASAPKPPHGPLRGWPAPQISAGTGLALPFFPFAQFAAGASSSRAAVPGVSRSHQTTVQTARSPKCTERCFVSGRT